MPDEAGPFLFAGKKSEVHSLGLGEINLTSNLGRMAFARFPGVNVWDMDGAGTQMNIGVRGSDPHRCIEMNMRQNGYNTNSDMSGYPENHYTAALQSVAQVQLVRGASSLQWGSQFGGMMNYVMKSGDPDRPIAFETEQTLGSDGLFNSFNAIGGTVGAVDYYASYDRREGDGWRPNAGFSYEAMYAHAGLQLGERASVALEFSRMAYEQQIAGGQTDAQFAADPSQSNRTRNFFRPIINLPALTFDYALSEQTKFNVIVHGLTGERSSVQFIATPDVEDSIDPTTGDYAPRQIDRDFYDGFTVEARALHHYDLADRPAMLATGVRFFDSQTRRRQKGPGTTGSRFDLSLTGDYGIDLDLSTINRAVFAENVWSVTDHLTFAPGVRYESIDSRLEGVIDHASHAVDYRGDRGFALYGVGAQYDLDDTVQAYANFTQSYRPYLYAYITPADRVDTIDPDLRDTRGETVDVGVRGHLGELVTFDVGAYRVTQDNRIGKLTQTSGGTTSLFTTNIGAAQIDGVEAYVGLSLSRLFGSDAAHGDLRLFNSLGYTRARYTDAMVNAGGINVDLTGNRLEGTPEWIDRAGLSYTRGGFSGTLQASYVSDSFSDATNTVFNPTGATGIVPSYLVTDLAFAWALNDRFNLSGGVNNLTDERYFTRRITNYPGPGILPADGRTFHLSVGVKF